MKIQVVCYFGNVYMLKVIKGPLAMRLEGEYSSPEEAIRAAQEKCPGTAKQLGLNYF